MAGRQRSDQKNNVPNLPERVSFALNSPRIVHARSFTAGMMVFHKSEGSFGGGLSLKGRESRDGARQRYVDEAASDVIWKLLAALKC